MPEDVDKKEEGLQIEEVNPESIEERDLKELVENLISSTFQSENIIAEETRMRIRDRITPLRDKISRFPQSLQRLFDKLQNAIYPGYTRSDHFRGNLNSIREIMNSGQLLAARLDNRTVGIVGYRNRIKTPDGRDIYEISKASTLQEYQGRGVFSKLAKYAFDRIQETYPDSPIMKVTANPAVKKSIEKLPGWKRIYLNSDSPIAAAERATIDEDELTKMIQAGFQILYFDPLENSTSPDFS